MIKLYGIFAIKTGELVHLKVGASQVVFKTLKGANGISAWNKRALEEEYGPIEGREIIYRMGGE